MNRAQDRLDYSHTNHPRSNNLLENEILSVQDSAGYDGTSQDHSYGVNDSRTSQVRLDSGQSAQDSCLGLKNIETSQRRSEMDRSLTEMDNTNQMRSDHNLVEMFSRCKLDPCYVSDSSVNDSVFHISPVYSPGRENSARGNILSSVNSDSKHNDISRPRVSQERTPIRSKGQGFSPTSISPLDPFKLWEESQNRMGVSPGIGQLFYQPSPDHRAGYQSDSDMITILPDQSCGISRLSMSYTTLENNALGSSSNESLRRNQSLSDNAESVFYSKDQNMAVDSVFLNHTPLNKSDEITFSNMSLPLPDSSYNPNKSQRSMSQSSQVQGQNSRNSSSFLGDTSDITPHRHQSRDRSLSSYRDDSSPMDRHSSYSSDKGLSLSDRAMTSGSDSYERSQRSFTSSGFQSEESNISSGSPTYMNQSSLKNQFHSGALLENEIMSIRMADESASEAVHRSVYDEDFYSQSMARQNQSITCRDSTINILDSVNEENTEGTDALNTAPGSQSPGPLEALTLPPLLSRRSSMGGSSAGLSASGRFFKDPTLPDDSENNSSEESHYPHSTDSSLRRSQYNEKSSLSAMISDMSSSKCGDLRSSDDSLSVQSSVSENRSSLEFNKARSLPYPSADSSGQANESYSAAPVYENIENYQGINTALSPEYQGLKSNSLPPKITAVNRDNLASQGNTYMNLPKGRREDTKNISNRGEFQRAGNSNPTVEDYDDSPHGLGRNVDLFNRDRWRASLDKAMRERLASDLEKMAPKKLYQLQSKNAKKNIPPMEVAEYNESPYKFRKPADTHTLSHRNSGTVLSQKFDSYDNRDYENIRNISRISDNSIQNASPNYLNLPPDYENVFNSKELLCPMARSESLTGSMSSGRNSAENFKSNVCSPLYSPMETGHVRAELFLESLSSVSDSLSLRSEELSRTKTPINTTGINSAFKPVISKTQSSDSLASKPDGNKTFTVLDQNIRENSMSKTKDLTNSNSEQSYSGNNSGNRSRRSDISRSREQSDLSLDQSSFSRKAADKSRRHSDVSRSKDQSEFSLDQHSFSRKSADKSRRRSDILLSSFGREGNNSTFPYSSEESSLYSKSSHSFNYLNYVGYPENYTSLNIAADDYSKNQAHSHSDSIPWEDSVNKSVSFQNTSNLSFPRSTQRQPLKALENTPTFSPIYGQDLRRQSLEMSARKRFMSTPKLSSGSDLSLSRNSEESGPLSRSKSKDLSASSRVFDTTNQENTSTWSTQQSLGEHSSLSKTTYI